MIDLFLFVFRNTPEADIASSDDGRLPSSEE